MTKLGDVIKIGDNVAVITRVPKGGMDEQYSFLYSDGAVDEEDEEFLADNAEVVGYIDGIPELLKVIEKEGRVKNPTSKTLYNFLDMIMDGMK